MAKLIPAAFDMETYYDDDYSLRKMTPEEYIRDPRFQILGCAVHPAGKRSVYITGKTEEEIKQRLRAMKWDKVFAFGHNMIGFDSLILAEKVGVRPRFWGCTLSMAGQVHGGVPHPQSGRPSLALDSLALHYGLAPKTGGLSQVKGKRLEDLTDDDQRVMTEYGNHDAELCSALFHLMKGQMPAADMRLIHWFIRMFAEPRIDLDTASYTTWLGQMKVAKAKLLESVGIDLKVLRSNPQFAALLQTFGVEPPMKTSKTTGKQTFAFAKTDKGMTALLTHPDETVQALAEARLQTKSSIHETRVERFIGIGGRGKLPVPLVYGKTHTLRAAGGGKINMQNLSKGKEPNEKTLRGTLISTDKGLRTFKAMVADDDTLFETNEGSTLLVDAAHQFNLRDGLMSPRGFKWVVADSSNIELRVAHCLAGQLDSVEQLRNKVDMYCWFAGDLYHREITKADKKERQHGKVGMLQLQYQSGWEAFREAARIMGGIILTEQEARDTVDFYRQRFQMIPKMWKQCEKAIRAMANGHVMQVDQYGLIRTERNKLVLPRGRFIEYKNLRQMPCEKFGTKWVYDDRYDGRMKNLYGGAMYENICQALAGIIVMDQCMTLEQEFGRYSTPETGMVLTVHDEGGMIVKDCDAPYALQRAVEVMSTSPTWWPEIPLGAEGDIAQRYGSAK